MATYTDIEVSELESSAKGARYVLSHGGRHYEANATVVELLRTLQSHADEAEAIADYAAALWTHERAILASRYGF